MKCRIAMVLVVFFLVVSTGAAQDKPAEVRQLTSGQTVRREIAGGETHSYRVLLRQGELLRSVVTSFDVDSIATIYGPDGQKLLTVDLLKYPGPEPVSFAAEKAGEYRLDVSAEGSSTLRGRYDLISKMKDAPGDSDIDRLKAERLLVEAARLETLQLKESSRQSIDKRNESLALWHKLGDTYWEAYAFHYNARLLDALGDRPQALEVYERALQLRIAVGDRRGEAETLNNIGIVYKVTGKNEKAIEYYDRAFAVGDALGDKTVKARTIVNKANVLQIQGSFQEALDLYHEALQLQRAVGYKKGEGISLTTIGIIYQTLADYPKALEFLNKALPVLQAIPDQKLESATLNRIGGIHTSLGDYPKALEFLDKALQLRIKVGDRGGEATTLMNIARVYNSMGEKQKALAFLEKALPISRSASDKRGETQTLNSLGEVYAALGERQKALESYNQALILQSSSGDMIGEATTLRNLMLLSKDEGKFALAILFGKQAVNDYQKLRSNIHGLDKELQKTYLGTVAPTYRELADLLISVGRLPEAQGVLGLLKEEEYFDFIKRDVKEVAKLAQRADLTTDEQKTFAEYTRLANDITTSGSRQSVLKAKIKALPEGSKLPDEEQAEYVRLTDTLDTANKAFALFLERVKTEFNKTQRDVLTDIKDSRGLQRDLRTWGAGTVALYTIVGDQRYRVILTTPNIQVDGKTDISAVDLNKKVLAFREAVQNPRVDPRPLAQELYNILIKPIEKQLEGAQAKTLIWSLDGTLRYLPLAALYDGKQYMVEKYQQVIITLASRTRLSEPVNHDWRGLGLGVSEGREVSGPDSTQRMNVIALPAVPGELRAIIREPQATGSEVATSNKEIGVFPGKRLLDKDFTARAFADALGRNYALVHIASHFSFSPGDAGKSFLVLGDGLLTLDTVNTSERYDFSGVELLTLSACETGVGMTGADGKEVEGFGALAQRRGAKAVLATLWSVADESTRELMRQFYRNYSNAPKISKAAALEAAQLSLLKGTLESGQIFGNRSDSNGSRQLTRPSGKKNSALADYVTDPKKPYAHPYFWAPFILIGNWQ